MAQNIVVKLELDANGAVANMEQVTAEMDQAAGSAKSMRAQLKELQTQLASLDPADARFQELSQQAGELKDKINDASDAIRANAGNAFESLGNNAGNLASRLISLDFEGVGQSAKAMAASVKNINMKALTTEIGGAVKGFATLGKALLTNPIFLIGAAVIGIITNFEKLRDLIAMTYKDETKALEAATANVDVQQEKLDAISAQENSLKLQGKSEREILQMKIAQTQEVINATKQQIEQQKVVLQAQIAAEQRAKNILVGIIQFVTAPLQFLAAQIDLIGEGLKKVGVISESFGLRDKLNEGITGLADMVFSPDDVKAKGEAQLAEMDKQLKSLENARDGHRIAMQNIDKREADERRAKREEADKAELERRKQYQVDELNVRKEGLVKAADEEVKLKVRTTNALITEDQRRAAAEREADNARMERRKANMATDIALTSEGLGAIAALNEAFAGKSKKSQERAFKVNKALSIAQALIQTYQSATAAYASQMASPDPSAPIRAAVAAGIAVATGLAQVAKIRATTFNGGGSSGGGGGGGGSLGTASNSNAGQPTFNPINTSFIGNRPPQTAQAYVIAGNVSNAQDANAKIKNLARLG